MDQLAVRRRFAGRLAGHGIEIGPGHVPFPVPDSVQVRYIDRWEPDENSSLFPELGDAPGFPEPDVVSNLDVDRLGALADASEDFVIASHIIEHLANPVAMLADIHRVLRPGGLLVLLVPDRHTTFDRHRPPTPIEHLMDEYERDVHEVADEHVTEFVIATATDEGTDEPVVSPELVALHKRRSIHVHVWDVDEFAELLDTTALRLGLHWEVIDTMAPGEDGTYGNEFGWLLAARRRPCGSIGTDRPRRRRRWRSPNRRAASRAS